MMLLIADFGCDVFISVVYFIFGYIWLFVVFVKQLLPFP